MRLTLAQVASAIGGQLVMGDPQGQVTGAAVDSRRVRPGDLFFALPGRRVDGHDFVGAAWAAGARAAVVQRLPEALGLGPGRAVAGGPGAGAASPPGLIQVADTRRALADLARHVRRHQPGLKVVGITGSVGKTTTKEMAAAVLAQRYAVLKSEGNYNTDIGLPLTLLDLEPQHQVAVLEMGMRGLEEIAHLASIAEPQVGVVTAVAESHIELLGSLERIADAKAELVEALPDDGVAVLNADDPRVRAMAARTSARVLTFGFGDADVQGVDVQLGGTAGSRFRLRARGREVAVTLPVPGWAAVGCALAAAAVGLALAMDVEEVARGLAQTPRLPLRHELRRIGPWTLYLDCYNASPTSTEAALRTVRSVAGAARTVAILGDMLELGTWAEEGHRQVGRTAARWVDALLAVGRWAPWVAEGWREGGGDPAAAASYADKVSLLADLPRRLQPGDVLLLKGSRAMAMEEIAEVLARQAGGPSPTA